MQQLQPKKGPETALQTIKRFAKADKRFKMLLKTYNRIDIGYPLVGVDRFCGECGLTVADEANMRVADIKLGFKAGVFDHYTVTDASGRFKVKASNSRALAITQVWLTPAGREIGKALARERDEKTAARNAVTNSPEYIAKAEARRVKREAAQKAAKIEELQAQITALQAQ